MSCWASQNSRMQNLSTTYLYTGVKGFCFCPEYPNCFQRATCSHCKPTIKHCSTDPKQSCINNVALNTHVKVLEEVSSLWRRKGPRFHTGNQYRQRAPCTFPIEPFCSAAAEACAAACARMQMQSKERKTRVLEGREQVYNMSTRDRDNTETGIIREEATCFNHLSFVLFFFQISTEIWKP